MKSSGIVGNLFAFSLYCGTGAFVVKPINHHVARYSSNNQITAQDVSTSVQADRNSESQTQATYNISRGRQHRQVNNNQRGRGEGGGILNLANPMKVQKIVNQIAQTDEEHLQSQQEARQTPPQVQQQRQRREPRQQQQQQQQQRRGDFVPHPRRVATVSYRDDDDSGAVADDAPILTKDIVRRRVAKPEPRGRSKGDEDEGRGAKRPRGDRRGSRDDDESVRGAWKLPTDDASFSDVRNQRKPSLRIGTSGKAGRGAELNQRRGSLRKRDRSAEREARAEAAAERNTVILPDGPVSVMQLAELLDEKPVAVIKYLMTDLGVMASMTQALDPATCIAVVEGFGKVVGGDDYDDEMMETLAEESALATGFVEDEDDPDTLVPRAPVVTIMGHVDHGKTSLLDAIRNTDVTAGEAGGITQHIAAYQVNHNGKFITFIDTPGHAAFTDMRERGANITDIVILVVAADDGVKEQTVDSISCARQAGVPLVVAINKCDLKTADPTRVMTDLTNYDILTEDLGGEVLSSQISAKTGANLDELLDKVMMQAELQDLKANPDRSAECIIVEANVERGLGTVATTLVKKGTLRVGDIFVAGTTYGKVRALISTSDGKTRINEASPSMPVRVVGFEGIPSAGDILTVAATEQLARELAESRRRIARERESSMYQADLMSSVARTFGLSKERREICVLLKADVQGSAEALTRALRELKLENDEAVVTIKVLVSEAGEVSKSDIAIASVTPGTTVLAFNVPASYAAMEEARAQGINIEYYNIVYDAIASVESKMQEVLSPTPDGKYVGSALVQEVFNIGGTGNIAGSRCRDGLLKKGSNVRVMRGDKILTETKIKSLRNFKAETDSIEEGNECGIGLLDFEDFAVGDIIECYIV